MVLDIRAVKVERSKKDPVLLSKSSFFSKRSTLTALISRINYDPELLYTSLESPNMQLQESEIKLGVALSRRLPRSLKCNYLFRATIFKGHLTLKELRYC